ncbi:MAG: hypothetical protein HQL96_14670 [Magnetococcales bacterium]|nr:hypothetical protein [Magnetococcales bacterium]
MTANTTLESIRNRARTAQARAEAVKVVLEGRMLAAKIRQALRRSRPGATPASR